MNNDLLKGQKNTMGRFFFLLWKARLPYIWILAYIIFSVVLTRVGINVTEYTAELFAGNVDFFTILLPFLVFGAVSLVVSSISGVVNGIATAKIDRAMRRTVWEKAVSLPFSFFQTNDSKELITRITNDTSQVSHLIMRVFIGWITSAYSVFAMLKQIGGYNSKLLIPMFVFIPANILIAFFSGRLSFGIHDKVNFSFAKMTQNLSERVGQSLLIKSFGTQDKEAENVHAYANDYYKKNVLLAWITNSIQPFYTITYLMQFILLVLVGRYFYGNGDITLPEWIAYFAFATQITNTISSYMTDWISIKSVQGAAKRVADIIAVESEDILNGKDVEELNGDIRIEDISFAFNGEEPLFEHFSLNIPSGKKVALIGRSGSGKTTLLNLIAGLYPLQSGNIYIGNDDISDFSKKSYRGHINYITQECVMFSGTIRQNLIYGLEREVEDSELDAACAQADVLDFINSLPLRYDSGVGENGSMLSGGQRQKLSMARMLLRRTDILFMDEATAAMDVSAKNQIWRNAEQFIADRTCLYVAHDRQSIENAEYVIVLDHGKLIDQGSMDEMSKRNDYLMALIGAKDKEDCHE